GPMRGGSACEVGATGDCIVLPAAIDGDCDSEGAPMFGRSNPNPTCIAGDGATVPPPGGRLGGGFCAPPNSGAIYPPPCCGLGCGPNICGLCNVGRSTSAIETVPPPWGRLGGGFGGCMNSGGM